jgi:hypothetical protein
MDFLFRLLSSQSQNTQIKPRPHMASLPSLCSSWETQWKVEPSSFYIFSLNGSDSVREKSTQCQRQTEDSFHRTPVRRPSRTLVVVSGWLKSLATKPSKSRFLQTRLEI